MEHAMASGFSLLRASRPIAATFGWRAAFASQSANEVPYDGSELSLRIHKTLSDSDASTLSRWPTSQIRLCRPTATWFSV